jgi:hypothetical protein
VMPQRGKSHPLVSTGCLSYPFQRILQVLYAKSFPALCPEPVLSEQIPLGQAPSLHSLRRQESHLPLFDRFSGTYWPVRLPTSVHRSRAPLGFTARTLAPSSHGQTWDLPVPVRKASVRVWGLRPRGAETPLAMAMCSVLPSVQVDAVGTPKQTLFRGSIPSPHFPLSTLRAPPCGCTRMTRGRCDSLNLHRMKLSFTTFRRFLPAHQLWGIQSLCRQNTYFAPFYPGRTEDIK